VSIQIKIRTTSETVVGDAEIQYQRHRTRHVDKIGLQVFDGLSKMTPKKKEEVIEETNETTMYVIISIIGNLILWVRAKHNEFVRGHWVRRWGGGGGLKNKRKHKKFKIWNFLRD
jgi:hypothetical protein